MFEALLKQTHPSIELLVVNDGSTDGAEAIWTPITTEGERGLPLRVHHQPPLGLSAGRQWAVEHAKGEWVAITDIDVRPEPDWVANMVAHIQRFLKSGWWPSLDARCLNKPTIW